MSYAVEIKKFGGPENLIWKDIGNLPLHPREVRIQVHAAGVNFADLMMRMGMYPEAPKPPFVPGYEISGTVIEVGKETKKFKIGDRVLAGTRFGGYTSEAVLQESQIRKIPASLSFEEAAAIPVNFLTAWMALQEMGRVRKGDRVLIQSAAGGVGTAAVQIATQARAHVVGLVGSAGKTDAVKSLGASEVLIQSQWDALKDSDAGGFQIILDSTGGSSLKKGFRRLAPGGRIITFGVSSIVAGQTRSLSRVISTLFSTALFTPFKLMMENKGVYGLNLLKFFEAPTDETAGQIDVIGQALNQILERFQDQSFKTIVGKTFPMAEAGNAHTYLQSRANIGKVILTGPK